VTLSKTIENVTLSKTIENVTLSETLDSITAKNVEFLMPFVLIGDKLLLHLTILLGSWYYCVIYEVFSDKYE